MCVQRGAITSDQMSAAGMDILRTSSLLSTFHSTACKAQLSSTVEQKTVRYDQSNMVRQCATTTTTNVLRYAMMTTSKADGSPFEYKQLLSRPCLI